MGIETFFFISLAVIFILLIALVYHFHQKFVTVEQRVNNVIEIINSVVKEMQNLKTAQQLQQKCCPVPSPQKNPFVSSSECINISADSFIQTNEFSLGENMNLADNLNIESGSESESEYDSDDSDFESESDDEEKIVVSDDEDNIDPIVLDVVEVAESKNDTQQINEAKEDLETSELAESISIISNTDFKKMDISQLRAIASAKGIDAKKMKKADLLKILEQ
jgi:hypothetical protein